MRGLSLAEMPADDAADVLFAMLVDDSAVGTGSRTEAREAVDNWLDEAQAEYANTAKGTRYDPDTWGLLPEHQSGALAALNLATELTAGA